MKLLIKIFKDLIQFYNLERLANIYYWDNSDKAKFICDANTVIFFLLSIVTNLLPQLDLEATHANLDSLQWIIRFCLVFLIIFFFLGRLARFSKGNTVKAEYFLFTVLVALAISLPILVSAVGVFDGFSWMLFFSFIAIGFIVLDTKYVIRTAIAVLMILITITYVDEFLPYKVKSYSQGDHFVSDMTSLDLAIKWFTVIVPGLISFISLGYLNIRWRDREQGLAIISSEDELTKLPNRRSVLDSLKKQFFFAKENDRNLPFSVGIIDIDFFKKINDSHGHSVGDQALRHIASIAKEVCRKSDVVGRYGGEEFLILFPNCNQENAKNSLDRLRVFLNSNPLTIEDGDPLYLKFSAGITQYRDDDEHYEKIIDRADNALYQAKENGRDQVICYS